MSVEHNHKLGLTFLLERDNIGVDTVRVLHRAVVVPKVLFADWPDNQLALETISTRPLIQPVVFTVERQGEPVAAPEDGGGRRDGKGIAHQFSVRAHPTVDNSLLIEDAGRPFHQDLSRGRNLPEPLDGGATNVLASGRLVDSHRQIPIVIVHLKRPPEMTTKSNKKKQGGKEIL